MSFDQKHKIFQVLYKRYFKRVNVRVMRILKNERSAAEDITQEAFLRAYNYLDKLQKPKDAIKWLYVVARNLSYNHLRDTSNKHAECLDRKVFVGENEKELYELIPDHKSPTPYKIAESNEVISIVQKGLNSLSEGYREAIELCCMQGLSYRKAAVVLNTNESVVAHNLMRARRKLSESIF